jgi:hypothetical protein
MIKNDYIRPRLSPAPLHSSGYRLAPEPEAEQEHEQHAGGGQGDAGDADDVF